MAQKFCVGDRVCDRENPRHVATIEVFLRNGKVRVRWEGSGWVSNLYLDDLVPAT